jgi:hypothetical protein
MDALLAARAKETLKPTAAEHAASFAAAKKIEDMMALTRQKAKEKKQKVQVVNRAGARDAPIKQKQKVAKKLSHHRLSAPQAARHSYEWLSPLSADDRNVWQQAIAALVGLKMRNGLGEKDMTAAVSTALRQSSSRRTCEDCGLTRPSLGLPAEGKQRWCSSCAKGHLGAANIGIQRCEDCQKDLTRAQKQLAKIEKALTEAQKRVAEEEKSSAELATVRT